MSNLIVVENQVLKFGPSSEKPGAWLKAEIIDDKGTKRDAYIKDPALAALVSKPGFYEFTKTKNGKYYDITGIKFLRPFAEAGGNGPVGTAAPARTPGQVDPNTLLQNKCITAQVCVKAAAEVIGKITEAGGFKNEVKNKEGEVIITAIDPGAVCEAAATMTRMFLAEIREFVKGKEPETGKQGVYKDDAGRTHEPVESV